MLIVKESKPILNTQTDSRNSLFNAHFRIFFLLMPDSFTFIIKTFTSPQILNW